MWQPCPMMAVQGVRSEFVYILRTSHLEPHRISIPYFSSIFEAYRTNVPYPYHYKKGVPYFLAKIETYRIVLPFLLLTTRNFNCKSAISIHTFSIGCGCLLPLPTKIR